MNFLTPGIIALIITFSTYIKGYAMTLYREAGALILGSRLKRFGDRFLSELAQIYKAHEVDFEPNWFPVFFLIDREKRVKISQLADALMITQSGATQLIKTLESRDLIEEYQEEGRDRRTKSVGFTQKGRELLTTVRPIWSALSLVMEELLGEGISGNYFFPALEELENNFDSESLGERVLVKINQKNLLHTLELHPWTTESNRDYQKVLIEFLSLGIFQSASISNTLKDGFSNNKDENLFLLKNNEGIVMGFALIEASMISRIYLAKNWQWQGVEEVFLNLVEALIPLDQKMDVMIGQTQGAFLKEIMKRKYKSIEWINDDIKLRRK